MKNKLVVFSNIMYCLVILSFFIMIFNDIRFMSSNVEDIASSIPVEVENILYLIMHFFPFTIFLIIWLALNAKCKKRNYHTWHSFVRNFIKSHSLIVFTLLVLLTITISCSIIYYVQNRLLYHPHHDTIARSVIKNLSDRNYEEIGIKIDESLVCWGWGYRFSEESPTILYFGGNAQTSDNFFINMDDQYKEGYNWVMIDYPGYGGSNGKPEYNKILQAADSAYHFVLDSSYYGNNKIIIAGFSLGTGVATYVASKYEIDKLILITPYDNGVSLYNGVLNIFYGPLKLLIRNPYPSSDYANNVKCPVLIIASEDDEVVSYHLSVKLENNFSNVNLHTVKNLFHNEIFNNKQTINKILQFCQNN